MDKMNDNLLIKYVDEIFAYYDKDRSGDLDLFELTQFFNEVFRQLGDNNVVNEHDVQCTMKKIDQNFNGRADKYEIFKALKSILSNNFDNSSSNQNLPYHLSQNNQPLHQTGFGQQNYSTFSETGPYSSPANNQDQQSKQYNKTSNLIYSAIQNTPLFNKQEFPPQQFNQNTAQYQNMNKNQQNINRSQNRHVNYSQNMPNSQEPQQQFYSPVSTSEDNKVSNNQYGNYRQSQICQKSQQNYENINNSPLDRNQNYYNSNERLNTPAYQQSQLKSTYMQNNELPNSMKNTGRSSQFNQNSYNNQKYQINQNISQNQSNNSTKMVPQEGYQNQIYPMNPENNFRAQTAEKQNEMKGNKNLPIIYGVTNSGSASNQKMRQSHEKYNTNLQSQNQSLPYPQKDPNFQFATPTKQEEQPYTFKGNQ